ncbi:TetR/AcrR family transcriptional regulator [Luteococcus sp. Sow4_B9]|uniref:TetR/AcrR family transcriptional regulator n=1 Tax=Luteococcus sp. Sow4_B9 TaxID=3438792 RepID=UPI003F9A7D59
MPELPLTAQGRVDGRSARKVETRRRIIRAASELFAEQGFTGTSMDQIAERADVSKGTIFYNFKNKSDLFEQLILEAASTVAQGMTEAREGRRGWDALTEAIRVVSRAADAAPSSTQIILSELFRTQRPWSASLTDARLILLRPLEEIFQELADDRRAATGTTILTEDERGNIAITVIGAVMVATMDRHAHTPERSLESLQQVLVHTLSGILGPASA